jgi:malonate-semialdehyde dehydrogenase (acetylating)/methylmalonate-semialdehyde dehydrogenase
MESPERLANYIDGEWRESSATQYAPVPNPATGRTIASVPLSPPADVDAAAAAAQRALPGWMRTPVTERVQYLYRLKHLLEENVDALSRSVTEEAGKTFAESKGEVLRGIENVEVACGAPSLIQGWTNEDVARGIDEYMLRQPVGVVAAITPFNFPAMIPLWFLPYALACGNCFILKPSDKTPVTSRKLAELINELGLPRGVFQVVHGGKETVDAIIDHPGIGGISFVGSTAVARYVYGRGASAGKRMQCQGGALNPVAIMPDADMTAAALAMSDAAYGCAGQRCLAPEVAIAVGEAYRPFSEAMAEATIKRKVGYGLDPGVETGPMIRPEAKERVERLVAQAEAGGAEVLVDGRGKRVSGYEDGFFLFPTLLRAVPAGSELYKTEAFGPVLRLESADSLDEAIRLVNARSYGNMACIFTGSGASARKFRQEVHAGNVGINVGVAAPMAFYPFSGWGDSFFGDLHAEGRHAVEFYTQTKVVVERWG